MYIVQNVTSSVSTSQKITFLNLSDQILPSEPLTPGTYGDATHVGRFTVNQKGILTFAQNVTVSGAGGAVLIEVNGVSTSDQTVLDFIDGTNTTVSNPSGGQVRIDASGSGGGGLILVDHQVIVGSPGAFDFTGLAGNTDKLYLLIVKGREATPVSTDIGIMFNNTSTPNTMNKSSTIEYYSGAANGGSPNDLRFITTNTGNNVYFHCQALINCDLTNALTNHGYVRVSAQASNFDTITIVAANSEMAALDSGWTEITRITLRDGAAATSIWQVGSQAWLYKYPQ